ncbi:MAG: hypothetical protein AAFN63_03535 [Pseudomonadota bacterium]
MVVGSGIAVVAQMSSEQAIQASATPDAGPTTANASSGTSLLNRLSGAISNVVETPKPRWELDQNALPQAPEGWSVVTGVGGGQSHALAKEVYAAMHSQDGPIDVATLAAFGAAQQPNGLMSEALTNARGSMQAVGVSEEEAEAQTAVNPLMVQFGDSIARKNDQYDQGRVYISGDDVVMVMIRRLPRSYRSKGSWLQITSPGTPVPMTLDGHRFMESARTADSDEIHAMRLDITGELFIEIGGRVDRDVLESFVADIDFAAL